MGGKPKDDFIHKNPTGESPHQQARYADSARLSTKPETGKPHLNSTIQKEREVEELKAHKLSTLEERIGRK